MQQELALIFFGLLAAATLCFVFHRMNHTFYEGPDPIIFFVSLLFVRILWRARVDLIPVAAGQGAVIVANHGSSIDPFFIQSVADRYVHWMVAREFCEHPAFGWFLKRTRAIPVGRRGIDTAATRMAIRCAVRGGLVGMFPEGRINQTDALMLPGRPGAVLVALKARVPIVPCYIEGSPYGGTPQSPLFMAAKVRVRFGSPMDLSPFYDSENGSGEIGSILRDVMAEIARLAGREDFQPQLAGRKWKLDGPSLTP